MKNFNDPIGNRTRNLPLCSAVPPFFLSRSFMFGIPTRPVLGTSRSSAVSLHLRGSTSSWRLFDTNFGAESDSS